MTDWTIQSVTEQCAVLTKAHELRVTVGEFYSIRPTRKWHNAKRAQVISLSENGALCRIGKWDGRVHMPRVEWLEEDAQIPYTAFMENEL